jgi:hypothetical protein
MKHEVFVPLYVRDLFNRYDVRSYAIGAVPEGAVAVTRESYDAELPEHINLNIHVFDTAIEAEAAQRMTRSVYSSIGTLPSGYATLMEVTITGEAERPSGARLHDHRSAPPVGYALLPLVASWKKGAGYEDDIDLHQVREQIGVHIGATAASATARSMNQDAGNYAQLFLSKMPGNAVPFLAISAADVAASGLDEAQLKEVHETILQAARKVDVTDSFTVAIDYIEDILRNSDASLMKSDEDEPAAGPTL